MILGLGMGERLVVPGDIKRLMQETGTSHLMAISGLHIALGAILGGLVVRGLQFFSRADGLAGECRYLSVWPARYFMPG